MTDLSSLSDDDLKSAYASANAAASQGNVPAQPAAKPASPLDSALAAENVPAPVADIARSIYQQESGSGANTKTSNAGAVGGMQIIPATFKSVADPGWDINNPEHNARAGVRYISQMYEKAGGDPALTAAGYYGGPGGLEKARQGVAVSDPRNPNAPNTLQYGQQVAARLPKAANPILSAANAVTDAILPSANAATPQPAPADLSKLSDEELMAHYNAMNSPQAQPSQPAAPAAPADNSFLSNLASGVKKGVTDIALGAKQRLDEGAAALENRFGGQAINQALGLQNATDIQKQTQAYVDQKRIDDAPLMQTSGGKVGNFLGTAAPAIAAAFIPGGQTLAGSALTGGILGAAQPTSGDESVTGNVVGGVAGGALGFGVGKGIGALAGKVADSAAAKGVLNAPRDTVAATARDAGYVIPPTQTNPSMLNSTLEGLSGKIKTAQKASVKNQEVTNHLAAESLGLDPAQPITRDALNGIRRAAGQAYDAVSNAGQITPTAAYTQALDDIARPYVQAAQGFPNAAPHPVLAQIDGLRSSSFDAASAVAKIKSLRAQADTAYRSGDKEVGGALKSGANALEDAIDTHLQSTGAPSDLLNNFRDARQTIAKTYSVENALNDSTGNVNAGKLASQLARGKPLSDGLKTIAQVGQTFPTAAKEVTSSMPGVSPLDFFAALHLATKSALGGAASVATLGARPLLRAGILSRPYQNTLATPSYTGSALLNGLSSAPARGLLTSGGQQAGKQLANSQPAYADGGLIDDGSAAAAAAAHTIRGNEEFGLKSMGYDTQELGYAPSQAAALPTIAQTADFGGYAGSTVQGLMAGSAFAGNSGGPFNGRILRSFANGGVVGDDQSAPQDDQSMPGIQPTPVSNRPAKMLADGVRAVSDFASKPFGYDNPPGKMLSNALGLPAIADTLDNVGYGSRITTGSGQATQMRPETAQTAAALLPMAPGAARLAGQVAADGGQAVGRIAQAAYENASAVPAVRGPLANQDGIFAGHLSKTADLQKLEQAKALQAQGVPDQEIHAQTGWFAGMQDKQWRYEIPDNAVPTKKQLTENYLFSYPTVDDVFGHPQLYDAYPAVKDVHLAPQFGDANGVFDPHQNTIALRPIEAGDNVMHASQQRSSTALHELQHAVQEREGFARGGSPQAMTQGDAQSLVKDVIARLEAQADSAIESGDRKAYNLATAARATLMRGDGYGAYRHLAGEAEARLVQARQSMTREQRAASYPPSMFDVPPEQQIVRYADGGMIGASAMDSPVRALAFGRSRRA